MVPIVVDGGCSFNGALLPSWVFSNLRSGLGTNMEDLEGGWLPTINGFSSDVRSMMKDFGLKIFVF